MILYALVMFKNRRVKCEDCFFHARDTFLPVLGIADKLAVALQDAPNLWRLFDSSGISTQDRNGDGAEDSKSTSWEHCIVTAPH